MELKTNKEFKDMIPPQIPPKVLICFRNNHIIDNKKHKKEIINFCNDHDLIPDIEDFRNNKDVSFSWIWYGFIEKNLRLYYCHQGWEKYVNKFKSKKHKMTNVYIIQSSIGGPIKIGKADDIDKRVSQLQNMNPFPLKLLKIFKNVSVEFEKMLHKKYNEYNLHGEWFDEKVLNLLGEYNE